MYEEFIDVSCSGMSKGTPPDPCMVVICGVAGDLGRTTLIPSFYALQSQGLLPEPVSIVGVARRDWHDDTFRQEMCGTRRTRNSSVATPGNGLHAVCISFLPTSLHRQLRTHRYAGGA
jgi:glucose-6-phosphate 1-dehydrogenase